MAQIEVLQSVRETGATRIGDLAERLRLAQSTVSTLVSRLVVDGLLARTVDPIDRRASVVELTDVGRRGMREWDEAHRRRLAAALAALPATDRGAVTAALPALSRLVDALDDLGAS
jgi:DNA-binding MarR family transcriptional regulator